MKRKDGCAQHQSLTAFLGSVVLYLLSVLGLHGWPFCLLHHTVGSWQGAGGRDSVAGLGARGLLGTERQTGIFEYPVL